MRWNVCICKFSRELTFYNGNYKEKYVYRIKVLKILKNYTNNAFHFERCVYNINLQCEYQHLEREIFFKTSDIIYKFHF